MTNAIASLERTVGARLLHRTTRRMSLTAEGEVLFERARQLLGDVAEARHLFGGSGDAPRGRLRLGLPVALAKPLIIPRLREFRRTYPDVDIVMRVSDVPADLVGEGIDCVLRIGDLPVSSLMSRLFGRVTMATCASPEYLRKNGTPSARDRGFGGHHGMLFLSGRTRRTMNFHFLDDGEGRVMKLRHGIVVNDAEAYVACAIAGFGVMQAPLAIVSDHLKAGRLVEVLPGNKAPPQPLSILYPNRRHLAPQVRAFMDLVTALLASLDNGRVIKA